MNSSANGNYNDFAVYLIKTNKKLYDSVTSKNLELFPEKQKAYDVEEILFKCVPYSGLESAAQNEMEMIARKLNSNQLNADEDKIRAVMSRSNSMRTLINENDPQKRRNIHCYRYNNFKVITSYMKPKEPVSKNEKT